MEHEAPLSIKKMEQYIANRDRKGVPVEFHKEKANTAGRSFKSGDWEEGVCCGRNESGFVIKTESGSLIERDICQIRPRVDMDSLFAGAETYEEVFPVAWELNDDE